MMISHSQLQTVGRFEQRGHIPQQGQRLHRQIAIKALCSLNEILQQPDSLSAVALQLSSQSMLDSVQPHFLHAVSSLLSLADASPLPMETVTQDAERYSGFLSPLVDGLESVLRAFEGVYARVGIPYAYGWSIVSLTIFVKLATYPFTKQQVESAMAVQSLKPQIDQIKARYGDDADAVQRETKALYEKAGVNPLAGCLPTLATLPVYFALYRSLSNVSNAGLLTEGFFWIPTLAGPQAAGSTGTDWLLPLIDGAPPMGWEGSAPYLVLPVLLVVAQWASSAVLSPIDPNDKNAPTQAAIIGALPLMIGWFSLNVPSGLSLYYFANSIFTTAIQIYLKKLGGATVDEFDLGPLELGQGRRRGPVVQAQDLLTFAAASNGLTDTQATFQNLRQEAERSSAEMVGRMTDGNMEDRQVGQETPSPNAASTVVGVAVSKRCKRLKRPEATPAATT